jgi:hypothetical protein
MTSTNSTTSSSAVVNAVSEQLDINQILSSVAAEARKVHISSDVCDLTCYCGVYALESKKFDGVRNHPSQLSEWIKVNHPSAVAHYVVGHKVVSKDKGKECGMLHVNFGCEKELSDNMLLSTDIDLGSRLTRCAGGEGKPCGISVLSFPELIYIHGSVDRSQIGTNSMANVAKSVSTSINEICAKSVLLDNVSVSENSTGDRTASVRFHNISDLRLFISHENTFQLWSRKTTIEVPNVPELCMCRACGLRGHKLSDCPKYSGLVVRFVFKSAVSELARQKIESIAKSAAVYTGLFAGVKRPNHMVHCIYKSIDEVKVGLYEVVKAYDSVLSRPPAMCDPKNKSNECHNCGDNTHRGNMCPLVYGINRRTVVDYSKLAVNSASPALARTVNVKPKGDPVCFAWSSNGECGRDKCPYPHPANRRAELGSCFNWRDRGECRFGEKCKYNHVLNSQTTSSAQPTPSTPKASSKPAPGAAACATGVQNDMNDDGFTVVPNKRKRIIDAENDRNEQKR